MNRYDEVPSIITGKDLDYLTDMFNWNYNSFKNIYNSCDFVSDKDIKSLLRKGANMFDENMNIILDILGDDNE